MRRRMLVAVVMLGIGLVGCGDSVSDTYAYFIATWKYADGTGPGYYDSTLVLRADQTVTWGEDSGTWEPAESRPNPLGPRMKEIRVLIKSRKIRLAEDPRGLFVGESGAGAIWKKVE